ncbi:MAG: hypothetical protein AABX47_07395 [Nanoarchaeota archaeon]
MGKIGQSSLFLVIAVFILLAIVMTTLNPSRTSIIGEGSEAEAAIDMAARSCLQILTEREIHRLTQWGGFSERPNVIGGEIPPIDLRTDPPNNTVTLETIQGSLSKRVADQFPPCIQNNMPPRFQTSIGDAQATITIQPLTVIAIINAQVSATIGGRTTTRSEFSTKLNIPLYPLIDTYLMIVQELTSDPESTCISCINELARKNGQTIEKIDIDPSTTLFIITQEGIEADGYPLEFMFGAYRGGRP